MSQKNYKAESAGGSEREGWSGGPVEGVQKADRGAHATKYDDIITLYQSPNKTTAHPSDLKPTRHSKDTEDSSER